MSIADLFFKDEVNELLTNGFNDKDFPVRPKWPDGTPAHTLSVNHTFRQYDLSKRQTVVY